MALEMLADEVQALSLSEHKYLPFNPSRDQAWLREKFIDIPRYLFRVFSPNSDGSTDKLWVKSKDAKDGIPDNMIDIFERNDKQQVAVMLNRHLRWRTKPTEPDNFVSWTSSLLFALQYVVYRHTHSRDGSSLDQICLCVIDTASFPQGVFLRDMDLIHAYCSFEQDLESLRDLRAKKHRDYTGSFYFGEYLSQGALQLKNKCQIVSAQTIIDQGLFHLRPEFKQSIREKPSWANEVIRLREIFYQEPLQRQALTEVQRKAAIGIAQLFGSRWKLPIAVNLIALLPRKEKDSGILHALSAMSVGDSERRDCSPSKTKVIAYDTMPEVQQYGDIMRGIYKDFCLAKVTDCIADAEISLRGARICIINGHLKMEDLKLGFNQDASLIGTSHKSVLRQLETIEFLARELLCTHLGRA